MKNSFVLTFSLFQIVSIIVGIYGYRMTQEKCQSSAYGALTTNDVESSFMVRVYNGYYFNGVLISENFVLTTLSPRQAKALFVSVLALQRKFQVLEEIPNEDRNLILLSLDGLVEFNSRIQPACLPPPLAVVSKQLSELCWVDENWLNKLKLEIFSNRPCDKNSGGYDKDIRLRGRDGSMDFCAHVVMGDRDACKIQGSALLNETGAIAGITTIFSQKLTDEFIKISEHVRWIESIVWPSTSTSTEQSSTTSTYASTTTAMETTTSHSTRPTESPDDKIMLSEIDDELHEIHIFLNVNLVLIVLILLLVGFISCILWSDGLCIRAVLPDSTSTDV